MAKFFVSLLEFVGTPGGFERNDKAAEDSRNPRRLRELLDRIPSARFWSAAVLCRFFPALRKGVQLLFLSIVFVLSAHAAEVPTAPKVDFNREIRPILAENCYKCHGPDDEARKAKLRFDTRDGALKPAKSGAIPIVPGSPEKSELVTRITTTDLDDRMPPIKSGKKLTSAQIESLRQWIAQGAAYATHWSYVKPVRPALPQIQDQAWPKNPIDRFILARLEKEKLKPSPVADPYLLVRRVSLDLTGLPPTYEEVQEFVKDKSPKAYEHLVDRLLQKPAFGEHWARMWLDLARYADSAGYADDPPRTIWAYRDYVIRAFNANKPLDRFTLEQIAGDLLDDPDDDDLIATAFHRNTMTNNEGGTSDEEFRNAAVVDRVNTTMSVWMATSMGCAQCHTHKYDPLSQTEYFRFFAFFNNSADADLKDESPLLNLFSPKQKAQRAKWHSEIAAIEKRLKTGDPESAVRQAKWEQSFPRDPKWEVLKPAAMNSKGGGTISSGKDNTIAIMPALKTEHYTIEFPLETKRTSAVRIEALPFTGEEKMGGYALTQVSARLINSAKQPLGRIVRIELPGNEKILSLAEVQVFSGTNNIAMLGHASQSSTGYDGAAGLAIDGNTSGDYEKAKSTTHTESSTNPWWEVELKESQSIDRIVIWNRTDNNLQARLADFRVAILDGDRKVLWEKSGNPAPQSNAKFVLDGTTELKFAAIFADGASDTGDLKSLIDEAGKKAKKGWGITPSERETHFLTLVPANPFETARDSKLELTFEQKAQHDHFPAVSLRVSVTTDEQVSEFARVSEPVRKILGIPSAKRSNEDLSTLSEFFRTNIDPELKTQRDRVAELQKQLADMKSETVPVMRELAGGNRRKTHLQYRGNYQSLGEEVTEAVPAVFQPLPKKLPPNRLALAEWLVDENNPLTARVMANRFWEQIFGIGIVRTSEDFGSQGDLPTHPQLLDWMATELMAQKWNMKQFLKMLVTSATYMQSSKVTPELLERDPENLLLARGPRFRMPAEVVRDEALAVSGLLSHKMYGPPVRPPSPSLGLSAAFGGSLDWKTSEGEDRYRRALYTEWRRTSPYPSMATFDAPNREVCTIRRPRSNTPLQALVTLNDPVYIEAAQALARRIGISQGSTSDKIRYGLQVCLARPAKDSEVARLVALYETSRAEYEKQPEKAKQMAGVPGESKPERKLPEPELAAWTVVGNVLLNLDEFLMKP